MSPISTLPVNLQTRLRSELRGGEVVTWTGQPPVRPAVLAGLVAWFFFIPWTAFALFWTAGAARFRIPTFTSVLDLFPLFGLPFILIGLAGLSTPWWAGRRAASTVYAITNERALILEGPRAYTTRTLLPAALGGVVRTESPDGSGTLVLETRRWKDSDGDARTQDIAFTGIGDVRKVEAILNRLAASAHAEPAAASGSSR